MNQLVQANAALSKFSRNYMELKKDLPIRPSEMGVLHIITEIPGPHTPMLLAELLGVSKPMITAHLTSLLEKGYIRKEQSPEDKRSFHILLTAKAQALVGQSKAELSRQLSVLLEEMGQEDFEMLVKLTQKANQVLETKRGQWP